MKAGKNGLFGLYVILDKNSTDSANAELIYPIPNIALVLAEKLDYVLKLI